MTVSNRNRIWRLIILLSFSAVYADITGKIAGRVIDSGSRRGLAGVNLVLQGTSIGTASNEKGEFSILNIAPGTYSIKATMIGYTPVVMTNVVVAIKRTTKIELQMQTEVLGLSEVTVIAERQAVVMDVSASQLNVSKETIESLPVTDVVDVIGLQAGVRGTTIRGGSSRQTSFIVDGFVINDERSNIPYSTISLVSINELQLQTGGFTAEYGNLRSGVINIPTKEGDPNSLSGSIFFQLTPPAQKHFGPSAYAADTYFTRAFLDPEVCYTGSEGWDRYTERQYKSFRGWNKVSEELLSDVDPTNDLSPDGAKRLYEFQHRRNGDITEPDHVIDFGIGGPVPAIGGMLGNLRFYASYRDVKELLIIPLSRDDYHDNAFRLKLTSDLTPYTKLTLFGWFGKTSSVSPYSWTTTPTGRVLRSRYEIANLVGSSSGNSLIYMPGWYSPSDITRKIYGVKINRVINNSSYYNFYIQSQSNYYNTFQMATRDTVPRYEIVPGYSIDEAPYGYWWRGVSSIGDQMRIGGWMNLGREESTVNTYTLRFDYTNQLDYKNQIKTGLTLVFNDYDIHSYTSNKDADGNPVMDTWNRSQDYKASPYRFEFFIQDKIEFDDFIANAGVLFDYTNSNVDWYDLSEYDPLFQDIAGNTIEEKADLSKIKGQFSFSPRLGVSHPITERSKLYFNYGHYYQEASSTYRFRLQREYSGLVTSIGDPLLPLEKTVSYELGYSHNLFNQFLLNVAAYYKDITNQSSWVNYRNIGNSVKYAKASSEHYEDIRGLELTLEKQTGKYITGFVNYTYMVSTSGYFGNDYYYENPTEQRAYEILNPYQSRPHPRPYGRANLNFHLPGDFGPRLMNLYPIGGWNLNVLTSWTAGSYTTWDPTNNPDIVDNVQWKDSYNVDLRLAKSLSIANRRVQLFADVTNVLNRKQLSYASFVDNYDYEYYMSSLHFDWEEGIQKGDDRVGEYRDYDVDFIPMETVMDIHSILAPEARPVYYDNTLESYWQYEDGNWVSRSDKWVKKNVLDTKAYIDMPNLSYFAFLYPLQVKLGIRVDF